MLHCLTFFSRGRCSIATTLHPPGWLVQWVLTKAWDDAKATNDPSIQRLKDPTTHRFQAFQRKSFDSWRWCSRWRSKLLDEFESLTVKKQGCIVCDLLLFRRFFRCLSHVSCRGPTPGCFSFAFEAHPGSHCPQSQASSSGAGHVDWKDRSQAPNFFAFFDLVGLQDLLSLLSSSVFLFFLLFSI